LKKESSKFFKANYDLIASKWCKARTKLPLKDKELFELFMAPLPPKAKILDLGCGSGKPISLMLSEMNHLITGVDRSDKLLLQAKKNLPKATFFQAEIEEYTILESYEAVVLWDVLFHIPRQKHKTILEKIYNSLCLNGTLILSSGGSSKDIPAFTDFMFDVEFYYDSFIPLDLISICEKIGFKVKQSLMVNQSDGKRDKGRMGIILQKTSKGTSCPDD